MSCFSSSWVGLLSCWVAVRSLPRSKRGAVRLTTAESENICTNSCCGSPRIAGAFSSFHLARREPLLLLAICDAVALDRFLDRGRGIRCINPPDFDRWRPFDARDRPRVHGDGRLLGHDHLINTLGRCGQIKSQRSWSWRASRLGQSPLSCSFHFIMLALRPYFSISLATL